MCLMLTCGCVDMESDRCRGTAVVTERCCSAASDMAPRTRHDPASQAGGCRLAMPAAAAAATTRCNNGGATYGAHIPNQSKLHQPYLVLILWCHFLKYKIFQYTQTSFFLDIIWQGSHKMHSRQNNILSRSDISNYFAYLRHRCNIFFWSNQDCTIFF